MMEMSPCLLPVVVEEHSDLGVFGHVVASVCCSNLLLCSAWVRRGMCNFLAFGKDHVRTQISCKAIDAAQALHLNHAKTPSKKLQTHCCA